MRIVLLLLAAGASGRMRGADKLLQEVEGAPCLRVMAQRGLKAGLNVHVTLAPDRAARRAALQGLRIVPVEVPDADQGMSRSLATGVAALPADTDAVMILPADMPGITAADLAFLAAEYSGDPALILRATAQDGTPGHPVIFPRDTFADFAHLQGDEGARSVIAAHRDRVRLVALPGTRATTDLDTPEDWAAWRDAKG
jgi:CTP:molybdopterin cytidylyltransferase MocA